MQTITVAWNGATADWSTAVDWSDDVVPTDTSTEVFDIFLAGTASYTVTISAGEAFAVAALSISDASASLQVDDGGKLTVVLGDVTNSGTFGVHNNTTVTIGGGFTNSGTLDVDNNGCRLSRRHRLWRGRQQPDHQRRAGNSKTMQIGSNGGNGLTTLTLGGLTNGADDSFHVNGSSSHLATLAFTGGASSFTSNGGDFELTDVRR